MTKSKYQIYINELKPGTNVLVEGKVKFSRIASLLEGEELERSDRRREENNLNPVEKPHTFIELKEAKIKPLSPDGTLSLGEQFVQERFYCPVRDGKPNAKPGEPFYTAYNKGDWLPKTYVIDPNTSVASEVTLPKELAVDVPVTILLNVYGTKRGNGMGLREVYIHGEPRYFESNVDNANVLTALGITIDPTPATPVAVPEVEEVVEVAGVAPVPTTPIPGVIMTTTPAPEPVQQPEPIQIPQYLQNMTNEELLAHIAQQQNTAQQPPVAKPVTPPAPSEDSAFGPNPWNTSEGISYQG